MKLNTIEIFQIKYEVLRDRPQVFMYPHSEEGIDTLTKMHKLGMYDSLIEFSRSDISDIDDLLEDIVDLGNTDEKLMEKLNRSISSGDIISVNGIKYLVLPVGFREI